MKLYPKLWQGRLTFTRAGLLRELKKAWAHPAVQGEVRKIITSLFDSSWGWPAISISRYFRKVQRSVKLKSLLCKRMSTSVGNSVLQNFLQRKDKGKSMHLISCQRNERWTIRSTLSRSFCYLFYCIYCSTMWVKCTLGENSVWWPGPLLGISS